MKNDPHEELIRLLSGGAQIDAKWSVRPPIGPDWIGDGRFIELAIDGRPVAVESATHRLIQEALIAHFDLPETSTDEVTFGCGVIEWFYDRVMIDFEWSRGVPYAYPSASDSDVVELALPRTSNDAG